MGVGPSHTAYMCWSPSSESRELSVSAVHLSLQLKRQLALENAHENVEVNARERALIGEGVEPIE